MDLISLRSPMHPHFLIKFSSTITPTLRRTALNHFTTTASASTSAAAVITLPEPPITSPKPIDPPPKTKPATTRLKTTKSVSEALLKENWLNSLSCPIPSHLQSELDPDSEWVLGIDPDLSGALAVLRPDRSVEVFDAPHLDVLVGKRVRKRLDAKSIVQLVQSFKAPIGTTVYIEQSLPFPQDGKQGWWSGGFGYGMWIGILVASGFSVVPVSSLSWKNEFKLLGSRSSKGWWSGGFGYGMWIGILVASGFSVVPVSSLSWKNEFKLLGSRSSKDASRELASALFPSTISLLKRKKDHGRAEALLIAAYGKGLKLMARSASTTDSKLLPDS